MPGAGKQGEGGNRLNMIVELVVNCDDGDDGSDDGNGGDDGGYDGGKVGQKLIGDETHRSSL